MDGEASKPHKPSLVSSFRSAMHRSGSDSLEWVGGLRRAGSGLYDSISPSVLSKIPASATEKIDALQSFVRERKSLLLGRRHDDSPKDLTAQSQQKNAPDDQLDICYSSELSKVDFVSSSRSKTPPPVPPVRRRFKKARFDSDSVTMAGAVASVPERPSTLQLKRRPKTSLRSQSGRASAADCVRFVFPLISAHRTVLFCLLALSSLYRLLPGFCSGLFWGIFLSYIIGKALFRMCGIKEKQDVSPAEAKVAFFANLDLEKSASFSCSTNCCAGWMNCITSPYSPAAYHVRNTRTVLVQLENEKLHLSLPTVNVPHHATCKSLERDADFAEKQTFDLKGAVVVLRPKLLARRRWWSRKYPICIKLKKQLLDGHEKIAMIDSSDSADSECDDFKEKNGKEAGGRFGYFSDSGVLLKLRKKGHEPRAGLMLFARSSREKEQWFYKLKRAASQSRNQLLTRSRSYSSRVVSLAGSNAPDSGTECQTNFLGDDYLFSSVLQEDYRSHLSSFIDSCTEPSKLEESGEIMDLMTFVHSLSFSAERIDTTESTHLTWLEVLLNRLLYDFGRDHHWIRVVENKIQSKLAAIHLPFFIEALKLVSLRPGQSSLRIKRIAKPVMNSWGLWISADLEYNGGLAFVFETKLNLMRLKGESVASPKKDQWPSRYSDEDALESPESSSDDDSAGLSACKQGKTPESVTKESAGKKFLDFVDRVAQTKSFQEATENKYVKKLMLGVSDTPLILSIKVKHVRGTLVANIPSPPSDRLWYGFLDPPKISLQARPKVGERTVNLANITEWIEKKLISLVEKALVIPNMDDIILPSTANSLIRSTYNK